MDGILGIGVPSGPINLSSSQETGRTALPSGFKRAEGRPQKGNTGVAIRASVVLASVPALFRGYPSRLEWIPASLSISCSPTTLPPDKLINAHLRTRFPLLPFARDTFRNFHSRLVDSEIPLNCRGSSRLPRIIGDVSCSRDEDTARASTPYPRFPFTPIRYSPSQCNHTIG